MSSVASVAEKQVVRIADVVFDGAIYPREKPRTSTINHYMDVLRAGGEFPPIVLEQGTNRLLDGYHRWKAYERYLEQYNEHRAQQELEGIGTEEPWAEATDLIPAEFHVIPDGVPAKLYAASLSTKHGDRLSAEERRALARQTLEENPDFTLEVLSKYLSISKSTAGNYVADIRARRREQQKMTAYRLHRLGWTTQEIADAIGVSEANYRQSFSVNFPELEKSLKALLNDGIPHLDVAERFNMPLQLVWAIDLHGRTDAQRMERLNINVQPYDVWSFSNSSDLFGAKHPGRIPGQLIAHVLYFFTEPGDTVVDPMSGSGTTQDVCLAMGRKCYAFDIDDRHGRSDVIMHNIATDGWHERVKKANLIFWDPPYFDKMDSLNIGEDGYIDGSISKLPRDEYLAFFERAFNEARAAVKPGTKLAFLMSDWDDDTGARDGIFVWDYANLLLNAGWTITRHIQAPLSTQQVHPDVVNRFRQARRLARLERYLLVAEAR